MKKIVVSLLLSVIFIFAVSAQAQTRNLLFRLSETPPSVAGAEKSSIASVRESDIVFYQDNFSEAGLNKRLTIPLFDGKTYEAVAH